MSVTKTLYGKTQNKDVFAFEIINAGGMKAVIFEKGATLDKLFVKDKNGSFIDVISGFDSLEDHIEFSNNQGVIAGQFANRIAGGNLTVDGTEYNLFCNEKGITCLHGGDEYSNALWTGEITGDKSVTFTYFSKDGTKGFPGNVTAKVTYTLTEDNELQLDFLAVSDKKTAINLTNHAYFNLNGVGSGTALNHEIMFNADKFTPIDDKSIPTGELKDVKGTPFSFSSYKTIGCDIEKDDIQFKNGTGYDHNFCITGFDGTLKTAAVVKGDLSGIVMEVKTDLPGIQFYTGNFLDGSVIGKGGFPLTKRCAFCLETQVFPDCVHHPEWNQKWCFDKDEEYKSTTIFSFS